MKNEFTKSNLKNGMIIQERDGDIGFIMDDRVYFVDGTSDGYDDLDFYEEDLTHKIEEWEEADAERSNFDIIKVWENWGSLKEEIIKNVVRCKAPLWTRKDEKETIDWGADWGATDKAPDKENVSPRMSKSDFVKYIQTLEDFDAMLNNLISTICPPEGNIKTPTFADKLESEYVTLIADMLGIEDEKNDELFDWCFADEFGNAEEVKAFDGCMYAEDVYEKLISK